LVRLFSIKFFPYNFSISYLDTNYELSPIDGSETYKELLSIVNKTKEMKLLVNIFKEDKRKKVARKTSKNIIIEAIKEEENSSNFSEEAYSSCSSLSKRSVISANDNIKSKVKKVKKSKRYDAEIASDDCISCY